MRAIFKDRVDAGRQLANCLAHNHAVWETYGNDWMVLALPRGGVPVAYEVATILNLPLDIMIVRKVGYPGNPEFAMGAIASGDVSFVNTSVTESLGISREEFSQVAQRELIELERREKLYRRGRLPLEVKGKNIFLIDDGIATGSTMHAAVTALNKLHARTIVIAVPTASPDSIAELEPQVNDIVCLYTPTYFTAVGSAYFDFSQTTDEDVSELLEYANKEVAMRD